MGNPITPAGVRQRIVDFFVTAGATDAAHAIPFKSGSHGERRVFARLVAFGAIREGGPGQHWLDRRRLADFRKEGVAKVLGVLAIAGLAAAGAMALGG